jgi:Sulfatase
MSSTEAPVQSLHEEKSWRRFVDPLILFTLGAFAVTQPLLSDFRAGAGYFVARRNEPIDIVLLVVMLTLIPGSIANLVVWAADGFSDSARRVAQSSFVGIFVALTSQTTLVRLTSINWVVLMVGSALIGVVAGWAYGRSKWFKTFLTYLIPAPLIFAAYFLVTPPVSGLVFPSSSTGFEAGTASDTPVVFVVFDEFPVVSLLNAQGGIDATRFPNFAALASMSTWYKYTAAAHDNTLWAVQALLTGQVPDSSLLPTAANYPGNLFTLLDQTHEMNVVEPFTHLCPPALCESDQSTSFADRISALAIDSTRLYSMMVSPEGSRSTSVSDPFNEFRPGDARRVAQEEFVTDQAVRFDQFLEGIGPSGPGLHFVHLFLPHAPFRYYPSGSQYNNGEELNGMESEVWVEPALASQAHQRHLLQVQMTDKMIGDLVDRLMSTGTLDDALVIVTADHGISFKPGSYRRPVTEDNVFDVGLVPLFIKGPHQDRGEVDITPARTVDVMPTLAAHLGLQIPWVHDGQPLLDEARQRQLTVQSSEGEDVLLDDVEDGVATATQYVESVFGTIGGSFDLYSFGDYDALIGAAPSNVVTGTSELTTVVDESWRLIHVTPNTGEFVPGFIHGELTGTMDEDLHVAVALNGVIETVVPTFDRGEQGARFSAILPDTAFVSGFNDLEVMAVSGSPDSPSVETIDLLGHEKFDMEVAGSGRVTRLVASDGTFWPVSEGSSITGSVDDAAWTDPAFLTSNAKDLEIQGWAVDETGPIPADRVVFFVNGVFSGTAALDVTRPDIQRVFEVEDVLISGFLGRMPEFLPAETLEVRAFALSGGIAKELPITDDARAAIAAG